MEKSIKWLRYSGLPEALGCEGWAVLMELVERDLEQHASSPGDIKVGLMALSRVVGLSTVRLKVILGKLHRGKVIGCFIPDNDIEDCIIRIADPVPTPIGAAEVRRRIGGGEPWRYAGETDQRDVSAADELIIEIARREIEATGGIINGLMMDQIRDIVSRHDLERIKRELSGSDKWEGEFRIWKLIKNLMACKFPDSGNLKSVSKMGHKRPIGQNKKRRNWG